MCARCHFSQQGALGLHCSPPASEPILCRSLSSRTGLILLVESFNLAAVLPPCTKRCVSLLLLFVVCFTLFCITTITSSRPLAPCEIGCCCVVVVYHCACTHIVVIITCCLQHQLYNTLSRHPVVCILCYTRFEPRVHSHHPRRGSLTAGYSGLCLLSYRLLFVGPSTVHTGSGAPVGRS